MVALTGFSKVKYSKKYEEALTFAYETGTHNILIPNNYILTSSEFVNYVQYSDSIKWIVYLGGSSKCFQGNKPVTKNNNIIN